MVNPGLPAYSRARGSAAVNRSLSLSHQAFSDWMTRFPPRFL